MVALVGVAQHSTHHPDDSAVRDDEAGRCLARILIDEFDESGLHAREHRLVGLVSRWTHVVVEKPGVSTVDVTAGQPLPRPDVDLAQSGMRSETGDRQLTGEDDRGVESTRQIARHDPIESGQLARRRLSLSPTLGGEGGVGVALHTADRVPFGLAMAHEEKTGRRHVVQAIATGGDDG